VVAAREALLLDGAIATTERPFEEGTGFRIRRILSVDSELSTKVSKCRDKFFGEFIYTKTIN